MESTLVHYMIRLAFALFVGGIIGIEREVKGKPAGMRTNMLMCMGSCLLMILSLEVARRGGEQADPGRIAAQVVTGIGFLGAGTILRSRVSVTGLTSAATLWFVAALGLVIGTGDYVLAGFATILIIITLNLLGRFEAHLAIRQRRHILHLRLAPSPQAMKRIKATFLNFRITPEDIVLKREEGRICFEMEYVAPDKKHSAMLAELREIEEAEILLEY